MKNQAIKLINKQAEAKKNLETKQDMARKEMANKILDEAKQSLSILGYEELLTAKTVNKVTEIIEVPTEKIVKVPGPTQVVKDMKEIEKHLDTINELKKTLNSKEQLIKAKDAVIDSKNNTIKELEAKIAELSKPKKTAKERAIEAVMSAPEVEDVAIEVDIKTPETYLKETKAKFKKPDVKMYETNECFFMASKKTHETTIIPKGEEACTPELELAVNNLMTEKLNFPTYRTILSPITVRNKFAYFARIEAPKGFETFSDSDKFGGYIKQNGEVYLFVYDPKLYPERPSITCLSAHLEGKAYDNCRTNSAAIDGELQARVKKLYNSYLNRVNEKLGEEAKAKQAAAEAASIRNAETDARLNTRKAQFDNAKKVTLGTKKGEDKKVEKKVETNSNNMSDSNKELMDSLGW